MEIKILELLNDIKNLIIGKVNERWLTLKEVSEYTSLSESTIRKTIQKGDTKIGDTLVGAWHFRNDSSFLFHAKYLKRR